MKRILTLITICCVAIAKVAAQIPYTDPIRTAAILRYTEQTKKTLKAQDAAQLMTGGMHVYIKEEVEATANFQKEFNEYLNRFNDVISIAAETYGLYNEILQTAQCIKNLNNVLAGCGPDNAVAAAMIPRRRKYYEEIVTTGIGIANDIRQVCFTETKMTEKERYKVILGMRPKLRKFNKDLRRITFFIHYTNFLDVWNEIMRGAIRPKTRHDIILECRNRWKTSWYGRSGLTGGILPRWSPSRQQTPLAAGGIQYARMLSNPTEVQ